MDVGSQGEQIASIIFREDFWMGVSASVIAAGICAIIALVARNAFKTAIHQRRRGKEEEELLDKGLLNSSNAAPFAFGMAQARALRHLVVAIFLSLVADVLGFIWPLNIAIYGASLALLFVSLRWFFKIERSGLELLKRAASARS